ncbi:MAG: TrkA family potassium uptake protein [Muribaculaceae bacterium]|nr:TrkA family potassium uptake protein [Muribaculaceae bacterium]
MRYLVIGLGIYGANLAVDLTRMGHEVIGADVNPSLVESIKDYISTAYIIDATDEVSLGVLPLKNVDLVIVAIGENFGASIRTVALLRKMEVKHIYARAIDKLHESILESFNLDRIITPEQRAASDLVNEMSLGVNTDSLKVADDAYVLKFAVPEAFTGMKYSDMDFEKKYGLKLMAVTRQDSSRNIVGIKRIARKVITISPDSTAEPGDEIVCMGTDKAFRNMYRSITQA